MKKTLICLIVSTLLLTSSCKIGRFFIYNFADIHDHKKFPARKLEGSKQPFQFVSSNINSFNGKIKYNGNTVLLDEMLPKNNTVAFLIIRNDSILYENYFKNYTKESIVPSFSVAKSFTSALIGCAIEDGYIKSVQEPVTNYVPELKKNGFDKVQIKHLLQMTSGLKFNESYYNPLGDAATFYYGKRLRKATTKMKLAQAPGRSFKYQSGSSQLLGLILERSLGGKTITSYLQEKIWTPLQMESDASWSIDKKKNGLEKTFCCLNATARDMAKFGRLYLNEGNWNGQQIIPKEWVKLSTRSEVTEGGVDYYHYQWWIYRHGNHYAAVGFLGEYIYVVPSKNLIMVRLGSNEGDVDWVNMMGKLADEL